MWILYNFVMQKENAVNNVVGGIFPIWQPQGFSTNLIAQRVSEKLKVKTSHTGILDPMAEGVIVVLSGETRLKKYEYARWKKTYEFEIVFGITTDTYDSLGVIDQDKLQLGYTEQLNNQLFSESLSQKTLSEFTGHYEQTVPIFSTKKIKGRHLHEYARSKKKVELPTKKGFIYKLYLQGLSKVLLEDLVKEIIKKINNVTGDFRQKEIISGWQNLLKLYPQSNLMSARFITETSKGIYVRSLAQDICKKINTVGFVTNLVRTKNGNYTRKNCNLLEELLGEAYFTRRDFVSDYKLKKV